MNRGFTLIEFLITLAVAAILVTVAVPNFRTFVLNARINNATDQFLSALQQARTEAITRGNLVVMCRSADPSTNSCGTSASKDWSPGWLMYATPTAVSEGNYNPASGSDHVLIRRGAPVPQGVTITSDIDGNTWLAFAGDGTLREPLGNGDSLVLYAVCDERGEAAGNLIVIPTIGRPFVTTNFANAPGCAPLH